MIRRSFVEFGQRWRPALGKLPRIPYVEDRDEIGAVEVVVRRRQPGRTLGNQRLHLGDAGRGFDSVDPMTRPHSGTQIVHVVVLHPGDDSAPVEINDAVAKLAADVIARTDNPITANAYARDDRIARIDGNDLAVRQNQIAFESRWTARDCCSVSVFCRLRGFRRFATDDSERDAREKEESNARHSSPIAPSRCSRLVNKLKSATYNVTVAMM